MPFKLARVAVSTESPCRAAKACDSLVVSGTLELIQQLFGESAYSGRFQTSHSHSLELLQPTEESSETAAKSSTSRARDIRRRSAPKESPPDSFDEVLLSIKQAVDKRRQGEEKREKAEYIRERLRMIKEDLEEEPSRTSRQRKLLRKYEKLRLELLRAMGKQAFAVDSEVSDSAESD